MNLITLKEGEFLLVIPELGIHEVYNKFRAASSEALSFSRAGYEPRIWNWRDRLVYGYLPKEKI